MNGRMKCYLGQRTTKPLSVWRWKSGSMEKVRYAMQVELNYLMNEAKTFRDFVVCVTTTLHSRRLWMELQRIESKVVERVDALKPTWSTHSTAFITSSNKFRSTNILKCILVSEANLNKLTWLECDKEISGSAGIRFSQGFLSCSWRFGMCLTEEISAQICLNRAATSFYTLWKSNTERNTFQGWWTANWISAQVDASD